MTNDDYVELNNIICRTTTLLPGGVKACTYHDEDGNEYVVVNDYCNPKARRASADHELRHIRRGEMYKPDYIEY